MNCLLLVALVQIVLCVDPPPSCTGEVLDAYSKCLNIVPVSSNQLNAAIESLSSNAVHLSICYGDYPLCNDIQRIALTDAGNCRVSIWKSLIDLKSIFRPCENPLPPRLVEKKLCTATGLILSEYYGKLYTDVVRNNLNEQFIVNQTSRMIFSKSNGQCLEAARDSNNQAFSGIKTAPCDFSNKYQRWDLVNNLVKRPGDDYCLSTDPNQRGALVYGKLCSFGDATQIFTNCNSPESVKLEFMSYHGTFLSEYYSGLYVNYRVGNKNEIFHWNPTTRMIKSESAQQCLDSYLDRDGKYKVHTYPCDVNNANQKWIVSDDNGKRKIEHATHKGQCLDVDPTYVDHHLQVWACVAGNINQQWYLAPLTN